MINSNLVECSKALHGYFTRRHINHWDAEDLVQEVLLKLWRMERPIESFEGAYIYTVARTTMIDKLRQDTRHKSSYHCDYETTSCASCEQSTPEFYFTEQRLLEKIDQRMKALTELQRQTLVDSKLKGMKNHEIAQLRQVTVSAVEKVIHKARQALREEILSEQCA